MGLGVLRIERERLGHDGNGLFVTLVLPEDMRRLTQFFRPRQAFLFLFLLRQRDLQAFRSLFVRLITPGEARLAVKQALCLFQFSLSDPAVHLFQVPVDPGLFPPFILQFARDVFVGGIEAPGLFEGRDRLGKLSL